MKTGTYGPRAVKEIPKPRYMKKSRPGSRAGGRQHGASMTALPEGDEEPLVRNENMASQERLDAPQRYFSLYHIKTTSCIEYLRIQYIIFSYSNRSYTHDLFNYV